MELTKRQQEAFDAIKAAGTKGIGFKDLKKQLGVRGQSTMRQRLSQLSKMKAISSSLDGKYATYTVAK